MNLFLFFRLNTKSRGLSPEAPDGSLLTEAGDSLLLEDGSYLLME
jgi:hypothetical protein